MNAEQARFRDYGHTFSCVRCRAVQNGIFQDDPAPVLATLGWHHLGDSRWVCSRTCLEWMKVLSSSTAPTPVVAVTELKDRAYMQRRASAPAAKK